MAWVEWGISPHSDLHQIQWQRVRSPIHALFGLSMKNVHLPPLLGWRALGDHVVQQVSSKLHAVNTFFCKRMH